MSGRRSLMIAVLIGLIISVSADVALLALHGTIA